MVLMELTVRTVCMELMVRSMEPVGSQEEEEDTHITTPACTDHIQLSGQALTQATVAPVLMAILAILITQVSFLEITELHLTEESTLPPQ